MDRIRLPGRTDPYDEYWPSRSSYFGICDLAGLPKDRYWLYRSKWNTQEHTTHLLPHWTWPGREGKVTPVYCYTDGVEGELFINGKSQGRVRKQKDGRLDRYRLRWNDVKYEPGEIKVVTYDADGNRIGEASRRTAGPAAQLLLDAECQTEAKRPTLRADGEDMAFVTVTMADKDGTPCPTADNQLTFTVEGEAHVPGSLQRRCHIARAVHEPADEAVQRAARCHSTQHKESRNHKAHRDRQEARHLQVNGHKDNISNKPKSQSPKNAPDGRAVHPAGRGKLKAQKHTNAGRQAPNHKFGKAYAQGLQPNNKNLWHNNPPAWHTGVRRKREGLV